MIESTDWIGWVILGAPYLLIGITFIYLNIRCDDNYEFTNKLDMLQFLKRQEIYSEMDRIRLNIDMLKNEMNKLERRGKNHDE